MVYAVRVDGSVIRMINPDSMVVLEFDLHKVNVKNLFRTKQWEWSYKESMKAIRDLK